MVRKARAFALVRTMGGPAGARGYPSEERAQEARLLRMRKRGAFSLRPRNSFGFPVEQENKRAPRRSRKK